MRQPEEELRDLIAEWVRKAEMDCKSVELLIPQSDLGEVVVFHAQQAVEKLLKAMLTRHQIEFPKSHEIRLLLALLREKEPALAEQLADCVWLDPFAVEIRYPADRPDILPGDVEKALDLTRAARFAISAALRSFLSGGTESSD